MARWQAAAGLVLALTCGATAYAQATPANEACAPANGLSFICGLQGAPEDLVRTPDSDWIIASGYSGGLDGPKGVGGITLIDPKTLTATPARIVAGKVRPPYSDCSAPPDPAHWATHGLNLRRTGRGKALLFAVSHGDREAIEVYDVAASGKSLPRLTWIGCVRPAAGASLNAVAPLPDGRIVYTDFVHQPATFRDLMAGKVTGAVYVWTPGKGARKIPGSDLAGPNGVEGSPDGRFVFVAVSATGKVLRFDLKTPDAPPAEAAPGLRTDNLRWGPAGRLLLAGPDLHCLPGDPTCRGRSLVATLDPASLKSSLVFSTPIGPAFPWLTSSLVVGNTLWLGTSGIGRVAYAPLESEAGGRR